MSSFVHVTIIVVDVVNNLSCFVERDWNRVAQNYCIATRKFRISASLQLVVSFLFCSILFFAIATPSGE